MSAGPREHIAVLQNPRAGRGRHRAEVLAALAVLRGAGREVRALAAHTVAHASRACHEAVASGAAALIVVGGGGTGPPPPQAPARNGGPTCVGPAGPRNDISAP